MPHAADRVTRTLDRVSDGIALSVGGAVILMVGVISYGVLAREVFKLSDVWVTDITTYLMGYMTFVGTACLAWQGRHLKIDVLGHMLGERALRVQGIVSCVIVTFVALVVAWLAVSFWWDAWDSGERSWGMFSIPLWVPYLSLLVGSVLTACAQLVKLGLLILSGGQAQRPMHAEPLHPDHPAGS
jgi:TRAP-type C4-dicarboxylate transport system permease small subunit